MLITRPLPHRHRALVHVHHLVEILAPGDERSRVREVLESLSVDEQADIYARFEKLDGAPFFNQPLWRGWGQWFKPIGACWEVGDNCRIRFYGFRDRDVLVLASGSKKRGTATPKNVVAECARLEAEYRTQNRGRP